MVEFGCMFNPDRHNEYYIYNIAGRTGDLGCLAFT